MSDRDAIERIWGKAIMGATFALALLVAVGCSTEKLQTDLNRMASPTSVPTLRLGLTKEHDEIAVLLPPCLTGFASLRVTGSNGALEWQLDADLQAITTGSTSGSLASRGNRSVLLGQVPQGFKESHPWAAPAPNERITVTVATMSGTFADSTFQIADVPSQSVLQQGRRIAVDEFQGQRC